MSYWHVCVILVALLVIGHLYYNSMQQEGKMSVLTDAVARAQSSFAALSQRVSDLETKEKNLEDQVNNDTEKQDAATALNTLSAQMDGLLAPPTAPSGDAPSDGQPAEPANG